MPDIKSHAQKEIRRDQLLMELRKDGKNYDELKHLSNQARSFELIDVAINFIERALEKFPNDGDLTRLAALHRKEERYDTALSIYDGILRRRPSFKYAIVGKAAILLDLERFEEAQRMVEEVLASNPEDDAARNVLRAASARAGLPPEEWTGLEP